MELTIKINLDNAAFDNRDKELARIFAKLRAELSRDRDEGPILDANGNRVGQWRKEHNQGKFAQRSQR